MRTEKELYEIYTKNFGMIKTFDEWKAIRTTLAKRAEAARKARNAKILERKAAEHKANRPGSRSFSFDKMIEIEKKYMCMLG